MRIDFCGKFPAVTFKLDPGEFEFELVTGEKLSVDNVRVDLWHCSIWYTSKIPIPSKKHSSEISIACKNAIMQHAIHTVRERLGIPSSGPNAREIRWIYSRAGYTHPEVRSSNAEDGCTVLNLGLYEVVG